MFFPSAGSDESAQYVAHHNLAYELMGSPNFNPRKGGIAEVAAELHTSVADVAVVSSENLALVWNDGAALTRLRDAILGSGFLPRPIVYLRPQASASIAVYAQIVCNGGFRRPFANYLQTVLDVGHYLHGPSMPPPFEYDRFLATFGTVFGIDSMIVRPYHSGARDGALLLDFARLVLTNTDRLRDLGLPPYRENGSLDFQTVLGFLGVKADIPQRLKFAPLTVRQLLAFAQRFRTSNRAIRARYALTLPAFELIDVGLATPARRTLARTRALAQARRALAHVRDDASTVR